MIVTGGLWAAIPTPSRAHHGLWLRRRDGLFHPRLEPGSKVGHTHFVLAHPRPRAGIGSLVAFTDGHSRNMLKPCGSAHIRGLVDERVPFAGAAIDPGLALHKRFPFAGGVPCTAGALGKSCARLTWRRRLWMGIGIIGLLTSSFRMLAVLSMAEEYTGWEAARKLVAGDHARAGNDRAFHPGVVPAICPVLFVRSACHVRTPGSLRRYNHMQFK